MPRISAVAVGCLRDLAHEVESSSRPRRFDHGPFLSPLARTTRREIPEQLTLDAARYPSGRSGSGPVQGRCPRLWWMSPMHAATLVDVPDARCDFGGCPRCTSPMHAICTRGRVIQPTAPFRPWPFSFALGPDDTSRDTRTAHARLSWSGVCEISHTRSSHPAGRAVSTMALFFRPWPERHVPRYPNRSRSTQSEEEQGHPPNVQPDRVMSPIVVSWP
jgi:hypothetical protein